MDSKDLPNSQARNCLSPIIIGCAGWNLRRESAGEFAAEGTHLQRYASRFSAVEINSSFYRPHRRGTYEKWSAGVPAEFRFSVKVPKSITHEQRLVGASELLGRFVDEVSGLGQKLGCLLVQLPPSLVFDKQIAADFFTLLRTGLEAVPVACEPRHPSWFTPEANEMLLTHRIARVAADPAPVPVAAEPGGFPGTVYYRLHGSPRMYYSAYDDAYLAAVASALKQHARASRQTWCIFDNTALGAATTNAFALLDLVR